MQKCYKPKTEIRNITRQDTNVAKPFNTFCAHSEKNKKGNQRKKIKISNTIETFMLLLI